MNTPDNKKSCLACGEPVKPNWKFCPACENPLGSLVCPQCGMAVKENWKRCPECEFRLVCKNCSGRIPAGRDTCPNCDPAEKTDSSADSPIVEPVTGMELILVPGGRFLMGDLFEEGLENEKPAREVLLDAFYIGRFPVTQLQWCKLIPDNPSQFKGENLPVEQVSWEQVRRFIRLLQDKTDQRFRLDLPSEAQWEFASRSGGREELYAGNDAADPVAWYEENSDGCTHPVGSKAPNGLKLYDMSGNVWEWCADIFREDAYQHLSGSNPVCTSGAVDRVIRGGSWNVDAWSCRCTRRMGFGPDFFGAGLGFRLVMTLA